MINTIQIALSGLAASTKRVQASASNIANLTTTGNLEGGAPNGKAPYSAVTTTQQSLSINGEAAGVKSEIIPKNTPFIPVYDPGSPFADSNGLIGAPNVNLAEEAVNISLAETTFKANVKVIQMASDMQKELLTMTRDR